MHAHRSDEPISDSEGAPSQTARTAISFFLFAHLFALFVAVASNANPVSALRNQLSETPLLVPYLQMLHLDLAYNYHLTYGTEFDTAHRIALEPNRADSDAGKGETLIFPDARAGLRGQRQRNLTLGAARLVGDDELEGLLPRAIARRMLAERQIDDGSHRLRLQRHLLQARQSVEGPDAALADPEDASYYRDAYEADLQFFDGELFLTGAADAGETAPVEKSN
jgi:hypothetical protein